MNTQAQYCLTKCAGKDVKEKELLCTVDGNVNWCSHNKKTVWRIFQKLKIELSYDLAIPFLGIYPKKTKTLIRKDISIPMFIVALFTIAKIFEKPDVYQWKTR